MAVDTVCWFIFACGIAFVVVGCLCTRRPVAAAPEQAAKELFERAA